MTSGIARRAEGSFIGRTCEPSASIIPASSSAVSPLMRSATRIAPKAGPSTSPARIASNSVRACSRVRSRAPCLPRAISLR
jgi:hypothetical protein